MEVVLHCSHAQSGWLLWTGLYTYNALSLYQVRNPERQIHSHAHRQSAENSRCFHLPTKSSPVSSSCNFACLKAPQSGHNGAGMERSSNLRKQLLMYLRQQCVCIPQLVYSHHIYCTGLNYLKLLEFIKGLRK